MILFHWDKKNKKYYPTAAFLCMLFFINLCYFNLLFLHFLKLFTFYTWKYHGIYFLESSNFTRICLWIVCLEFIFPRTWWTFKYIFEKFLNSGKFYWIQVFDIHFFPIVPSSPFEVSNRTNVKFSLTVFITFFLTPLAYFIFIDLVILYLFSMTH